MIRKIFLLLVYLTFSFSSCSAYDYDEENDMSYAAAHALTNSYSEYIALFGDVQYYSNSEKCKLYQHSCDWILNQKASGMKVNSVIHTGDCTQSNTGENWKYFFSPTQKLAEEIPYFSLIGDHDYTWDESGRINDRDDTYFNEYVQFPLANQKVIERFEAGRAENIIVKNEIQRVPVYFLILEFGPRNEVVNWANNFVKTHSEVNFILMTHEYLEMGGGRRTKGLKSAKRLRNTTYLTPDELWNQLIKKNNNIICVFCGHVGGLYAYTLEKNEFGREIPQIQHNIQSAEYRYDNWLMLWEFPQQSDSVNVSIINTKTLKYFNDTSALFKFRYKYSKTPASIRQGSRNRQENHKALYNLNGTKVDCIKNSNGVFIENGKKIQLHR